MIVCNKSGDRERERQLTTLTNPQSEPRNLFAVMLFPRKLLVA